MNSVWLAIKDEPDGLNNGGLASSAGADDAVQPGAKLNRTGLKITASGTELEQHPLHQIYLNTVNVFDLCVKI